MAPASSPLGRSIAFAAAVSLYILALVLLERPTRLELGAYGFLLLFFWFFEFVFPLITQRAKRGYLTKLAAQEEVERKVETLIDLLLRRVGRPQALVIVTLGLLLVFAHAAGRGQARRQRDFLVPASEPSYVVLRQYGDRFILGKVQEGGATVGREFRILVPAGEQASSSESFLLKRIGPLTPLQVSEDPAA
jgi:hypothetical protein